MRTIWKMIVCCFIIWGIVNYNLLSRPAYAAGGVGLDTTRVIYIF